MSDCRTLFPHFHLAPRFHVMRVHDNGIQISMAHICLFLLSWIFYYFFFHLLFGKGGLHNLIIFSRAPPQQTNAKCQTLDTMPKNF